MPQQYKFTLLIRYTSVVLPYHFHITDELESSKTYDHYILEQHQDTYPRHINSMDIHPLPLPSLPPPTILAPKTFTPKDIYPYPIYSQGHSPCPWG